MLEKPDVVVTCVYQWTTSVTGERSFDVIRGIPVNQPFKLGCEKTPYSHPLYFLSETYITIPYKWYREYGCQHTQSPLTVQIPTNYPGCEPECPEETPKGNCNSITIMQANGKTRQFVSTWPLDTDVVNDQQQGMTGLLDTVAEIRADTDDSAQSSVMPVDVSMIKKEIDTECNDSQLTPDSIKEEKPELDVTENQPSPFGIQLQKPEPPLLSPSSSTLGRSKESDGMAQLISSSGSDRSHDHTYHCFTPSSKQATCPTTETGSLSSRLPFNDGQTPPALKQRVVEVQPVKLNSEGLSDSKVPGENRDCCEETVAEVKQETAPCLQDSTDIVTFSNTEEQFHVKSEPISNLLIDGSVPSPNTDSFDTHRSQLESTGRNGHNTVLHVPPRQDVQAEGEGSRNRSSFTEPKPSSSADKPEEADMTGVEVDITRTPPLSVERIKDACIAGVVKRRRPVSLVDRIREAKSFRINIKPYLRN